MGRNPKKSVPTPSAKSSIKIKAPETIRESPETKPPIFSFEYHVTIDKRYCIDNCENNAKIALLERLFRLSKYTWSQLRMADRHKIGHEELDPKKCKITVPDGLKDKNFIAFRFMGLEPVVGFRDERIFNIVWVDPNFELYEHS